jgi:chemotaxis protein MotB
MSPESGAGPEGGQFASNWDLASARANAVARYLLEQGFAPSRLQSVSYADTRPVASNDSEAGRAANRRVELQIGFIDEN